MSVGLNSKVGDAWGRTDGNGRQTLEQWSRINLACWSLLIAWVVVFNPCDPLFSWPLWACNWKQQISIKCFKFSSSFQFNSFNLLSSHDCSSNSSICLMQASLHWNSHILYLWSSYQCHRITEVVTSLPSWYFCGFRYHWRWHSNYPPFILVWNSQIYLKLV